MHPVPGGILAWFPGGKSAHERRPAVSTRTTPSSLRRRLTQRLLRPRLAYADPLQRLALLGVAAGAVTGVVLADRIKSLDWWARRIRFESKAPPRVVSEVFEKLAVLLDQNES